MTFVSSAEIPLLSSQWRVSVLVKELSDKYVEVWYYKDRVSFAWGKAFAYYSTRSIWIGNEIQITIKYSTQTAQHKSTLDSFLFIASILLQKRCWVDLL